MMLIGYGLPSRPITMVLPFAAGGTTDTLVRIIAARMQVLVGQPVIIENVSGAAGTISLGRAAPRRIYNYCGALADAVYKLPFDLLIFEPVVLLANNPSVNLIFPAGVVTVVPLSSGAVSLKVFIAGASGYIGGSVAAALMAAGHQVSGLARSDETAAALTTLGIRPVHGTLDDTEVLAKAARDADVTINAANAGHRAAAAGILKALAGTGKIFLHTDGSSIVGTRSRGELVEKVFDEDTLFTPTPQRAARMEIDKLVRDAADNGVRSIVIAPSLIYGLGHGLNPHSIQVPWLIKLAKKFAVAKHIGAGENRWANVHIDDLMGLYLLAIEKAPAGAFYFAENGENSMREVCEAISRMLGQGGRTESMTVEEAVIEWGEGPANDTMGSNSRVRAKRARAELDWQPKARPLIDEIEFGCYVQET